MRDSKVNEITLGMMAPTNLECKIVFDALGSGHTLCYDDSRVNKITNLSWHPTVK